LRSKVESAFHLSFPVIPSEADEWSSWENRDIYGKTELSERAVSESNLSMLVFLCRKITHSFSSIALSVSHRIVFSPPMGVRPITSLALPQSAAEIPRAKVYWRVLAVFLSPLTIVVALTLNLQNTAEAAEPSETKAELVDIGGGRKMYLECRGTGSPTVVLISGTRSAYDDWTDLIDPRNPAGAIKAGESAVFSQVSRFSRVCAYDRPGTTRNDNKVTDSTPVRQPTTAQQGVADLHALLTAAMETRPYVLVGHSWGGLIARLFASTYPDEVASLVLVDPASEFLKTSLTPAQWATYIKATKKLIESNGLEAPDHMRTLDMLHGTPKVRAMPIVVLTSDKRFDFGAGGSETWPAWRTAQDRLAKVLKAKHVSDTNSGHAIQMEQPQLVTNVIRQVVEAVRSGSHQVARNRTEAELPSIAESSRIALEKALDEGFAKSDNRTFDSDF
jgi:pimeloyl-ACP methyl ester carboxylesterase